MHEMHDSQAPSNIPSTTSAQRGYLQSEIKAGAATSQSATLSCCNKTQQKINDPRILLNNSRLWSQPFWKIFVKTGQYKHAWKHHQNFILSLMFEQLLCIVVDICSKDLISCSSSRTRLSVWSAYHLLPQNQLSSLASFFENKKTKNKQLTRQLLSKKHKNQRKQTTWTHDLRNPQQDPVNGPLNLSI